MSAVLEARDAMSSVFQINIPGFELWVSGHSGCILYDSASEGAVVHVLSSRRLPASKSVCCVERVDYLNASRAI